MISNILRVDVENGRIFEGDSVSVPLDLTDVDETVRRLRERLLDFLDPCATVPTPEARKEARRRLDAGEYVRAKR